MQNTSSLKAIYVLSQTSYDRIYSQTERSTLSKLVDTSAGVHTAEHIKQNLHLLKDIDILLTGWNGPVIDQEFLDAAPNLKAVFYGAGSIRPVVTPAFWKSEIPITCAASVNAIPVSEYTLSQILFCLKLGWQHTHLRTKADLTKLPVHGAFRSTVGLISMGAIAKRVRNLLRNHEVKVIAYDPFMTHEQAEEWDVELVSLQELFKRSAVTSLHAPDIDATKGMIRHEHFEAMPKWASFINTARSATVRHTELCDVLEKRPDLWAVIDVTEEATEEEHQRLIQLHNVTLTPHIAGSLSTECHRMGKLIFEEVQRFVENTPLEYALTEQQASIMA